MRAESVNAGLVLLSIARAIEHWGLNRISSRFILLWMLVIANIWHQIRDYVIHDLHAKHRRTH